MAKLEDSWRRFSEKSASYTAYANAWEAKIGAFLSFNPQQNPVRDLSVPTGDSDVAGLPFGVKDNIAVAGFPLTCGS